jgi:hypothetical protein
LEVKSDPVRRGRDEERLPKLSVGRKLIVNQRPNWRLDVQAIKSQLRGM